MQIIDIWESSVVTELNFDGYEQLHQVSLEYLSSLTKVGLNGCVRLDTFFADNC